MEWGVQVARDPRPAQAIAAVRQYLPKQRKRLVIDEERFWNAYRESDVAGARKLGQALFELAPGLGEVLLPVAKSLRRRTTPERSRQRQRWSP